MKMPKALLEADRIHQELNGENNFNRMAEQTAEECAEVVVSLAHLKRGRCTEKEVLEECADVIICINALVKYKRKKKEFQKMLDTKSKKYLSQMRRKFK